ncbi:hypothetical protein SAMN04489737_1114 [Arcanobacterium phocae]|uniref:Uncharacterized protein n=1 Tax=Arcanobacterium phocae TaxID=131112 RepID=A0A1H2LGL0_9ACTO|nr:hypothetical protein [Arcanobacterium phocae]SDU80157.1 hypothetical protein SAMN04489737_1114 [Arcanobacterium phocae]
MVTEEEDDKADVPDGKLFRTRPVQVITTSQKVIHTGFRPEQKIMAGLESMLQKLARLSESYVISHIDQKDPVLQTVHRGG